VSRVAKRKIARDGVMIPIKLQPESNNLVDSKAIVFMCTAVNNWARSPG